MTAGFSYRLAKESLRLPRSIPTTLPQPPQAPAPKSYPPGPIYRILPKKVLLYSDRGLAVINKPNGLVSQLSNPHYEREEKIDIWMLSTLLKDLQDHLGIYEAVRPLHRLDKPATGAFVLSCNRASERDYMHQIRTDTAEKTYLALVCGDPSRFNKQKSGVIKTELECIRGWVRIPGVKGVYERDLRRESSPGPGENWVRETHSEYEVLASSPKLPLTLLRLRLLTGAKHQLRVHLSQYLRTPILGDALYMNPASPMFRAMKQAIKIPRSLYLHSSRFSLNRFCPSRFRLTIGAPLPPSFVNVCKQAEIPLDLDDQYGGVWVDDKKVRGPGVDVSPESMTQVGGDEVARVGGEWYGPTTV